MSCFKDLRGVKWNVSKMESGKHPYTHNPWTSLGGGQFQYPLRKKGIIPLFFALLCINNVFPRFELDVKI